MRSKLIFVAAIAAMCYFLQAGHWAMIGALLSMIVAHEFGHWIVARLCGIPTPVFSVGFGSSPRIVLGKFWDTEFQITPWLAGGFVQIDPSDNTFAAKPARQRAAVLVAGVVMNVLLAFGIVFGLLTTVGQREIVPIGVAVNQLPDANAIAAKAGLQAGDEIVSVDGVAVNSPDVMRQQMLKHTDGSTASIVVKRGADQLTFNVNPDKDGRIGVVLSVKATEKYTRLNPIAAFGQTASTVWMMGTQLIVGVLMMLHIVPLPQGLPEGAADVHGLVAIVQMGQLALQNGIYSFGYLCAFISMNLAVFNILPIPMLDGGHLLFIGLEKVRGKPVSANVQRSFSTLFFLLLMGLMVFGLYNDVAHPVNFGAPPKQSAPANSNPPANTGVPSTK